MNRASLILSRAIWRWPVPIIAITMVAALVLSFGIPRIEFKTGQETLIDPDSKVARDNERFQRQFGGDPVLILFDAPGGDITQLFTPENRAELARFQAQLEASGNFQSVITPLLVLEFAMTQVERRMIEQPAQLARDQDAAAAEARAEAAARGAAPEEQDAAEQAARQRVADEFQAEFGADAQRFLAIADRSLDNPEFVAFVIYDADGNVRPDVRGIFPDEHHALMVARMQGNLSIDESSAAAGEVVDIARTYEFEGVNALVSGPPLLIKEINDQMRSALVVMAIFAVVIMMIVLSLVLRARWQLLSLPAVLVGCVAAFGLMGFLGIPLTLVTISGLPILIGLGVDAAIQAHSRLEEETFASGSAETGIDEAYARLGPPLTIALLAGCVGFLVLLISDVPMIRDFGVMLAVGSAIVFFTSIVLVSAVIFLRERTRIGPRATIRARLEVERVVTGITARTMGRLAPIAAIAIVIALGGLYFGRMIPTETDPERFVPSDSGVLRDLHLVRDVTGSTSELNLLVETSRDRRVTDDVVIAWMASFEDRQRETHATLTRSNSLASLTRSLTGAPPTSESAQLTMESAPPALVSSVVNEDATQASITFAIGGAETLADRKRLTRAIEASANPPEGVTVAPAGIAVVGIASVDAMSANRDLMSFVALASVFGTLLLFLRNPVKAIAPLLPIVLALGASSMLLYLLGVEYSPLTSVSGPLIIAMGTEFSVLLMSRYFEERNRGLDPRSAMSRASLRIGRAITASGLTVMGGFAVLAFTGFPLLDSFGKVTALNIGLSLVSTLVLLPPLLVWADEDRGIVGYTPAEALPER